MQHQVMSVENFIQKMMPYDIQNLDKYFEVTKNVENDFFANTSSIVVAKNFIYYQVIMVFVSSMIAYVTNSDLTVKFLTAIFLSTCFFFAGLVVVYKFWSLRFKSMQVSAWANLVEVKEVFFYENSFDWSAIKEAVLFHGDKDFVKIKKNIATKSLTNKELYFILSCSKNEKYYKMINNMKAKCVEVFNLMKIK